jgi:hypothetical protein
MRSPRVALYPYDHDQACHAECGPADRPADRRLHVDIASRSRTGGDLQAQRLDPVGGPRGDQRHAAAGGGPHRAAADIGTTLTPESMPAGNRQPGWLPGSVAAATDHPAARPRAHPSVPSAGRRRRTADSSRFDGVRDRLPRSGVGHHHRQRAHGKHLLASRGPA